METHLGVIPVNTEAIAMALAKVLADENVLYIKTKNAHWNVEGPDFFEKHQFLETQFIQLDTMIDSIAERIRSIGHYAPATLSLYLKLTQLTEKKKSANNSQELIKELLMDHISIIAMLRKHINPLASEFHYIGTTDYIKGLMQAHEKMAWFLRSHLNN